MDSNSYFLQTQRLGFRWWQAEDLLLARELWGDPEVTRLFSKSQLTDAQIQERLTIEIERATKHGIQYWPMFELSTNHHIGCAGLRPYRPEENIFEMGYHLRPEFWGKGFATEAGKAILEYAMKHTDATSIFAGHHPDNVASGKVLLKLDFTQTGTDYFEPTGLMHPSYIIKFA